VHGTIPAGRQAVRFTAAGGRELPAQGFAGGDAGSSRPADGDSVQIAIAPTASACSPAAVPRWMGRDFAELPTW